MAGRERIVTMLRRWLPMLQQEMEGRIEELVVQLKVKASSPPQITGQIHHQGLSYWLLSVVTSVRHDQVMNLDSNVLNLSEMLP